MKPVQAASLASVLVAVFLLGLSISANSAPPAESALAVAPELDLPADDPDAADAQTPASPAPPPQVIYIQVPLQAAIPSRRATCLSSATLSSSSEVRREVR